MQFTTLVMAMAATAVSAIPLAAKPRPGFQGQHTEYTDLVPRQASGHATYYNTMYPTFSSCGDQPHDTDMIAAVAASFMPSACGRNAIVTNGNTGAQITVKIVDTCVACSGGSVAIDLTPTAFEALGASLSDGTVPASWAFA